MSSGSTFAVWTKDIRERADVSFAFGRRAARQALEHALYPTRPLGELTQSIQYGSSARADLDESGIPMIRMVNLQDDGWSLNDLKYVSRDTPDIAKHLLALGDLVINRTNTKDLVGKSAVWSEPGSWIYASYLVRAKVKEEEAHPGFLSAVLNSMIGRAQIDQLSRQIAGMTNINTGELRSLEIPLPPLAVQNALAAEYEGARRERDSALAKADQLLSGIGRVVLDDLGITRSGTVDTPSYAVSRASLRRSGRLDPASYHPERVRVRALLSEIEGLTVRRLGDVAAIESRRMRLGIAEEDPGAYVGLADIRSGTGEIADRQEDERPTAGLQFRPNEILYGRLRPRLNKVWLADRSGVCSTEFRVLRVSAPEIRPGFLALALLSPTTLAQTVPLAAGNTHPRLSDEEILEVMVPVPNLATQKRIESDVAKLQKAALALRQGARAAWAQAKDTFVVALVGDPDG
jgi:type I restriction enzyme S subunit